jgi:large subunit ribosomal protein L15
MASLNNMKRTTKKALRRVGRGQGSKRGKTSGRGTKGQNARAGRKKRPELRDFIKKLPKRRGFGKNRARTVNSERPRPFEVSLTTLASVFAAGGVVSPQSLIEKGVITPRGGKVFGVKILGNEAIDTKLTVQGCAASKGAKAAIEKAGGTIA